MNPFEYFQEMRHQIERDTPFMENLRYYAFTDRLRLDISRVAPLGAGRSNIHFRIGKVGDLWLASREHINEYAFDPEDRLAHNENYIDAVVRAHGGEKRVPIICGGVKAEGEYGLRYFLLLEDLTQGGLGDFQPAPRSGGVVGILNGERVWHDFDTDYPYRPEIRYMRDDKVILLRKSSPKM